MTDVNWDIELKRIEREFDGLPPEPRPRLQTARRAPDRHAREEREARGAGIGAWARLLLVGALAVGLYYWPYARVCGAGLFVYLGAATLMTAGGLWVAAWTWRWRLARTHALALLMVLASFVVIGADVLPRVGYAQVDPGHPPRWSCK